MLDEAAIEGEIQTLMGATCTYTEMIYSSDVHFNDLVIRGHNLVFRFAKVWWRHIEWEEKQVPHWESTEALGSEPCIITYTLSYAM